MNFDIIIPVDYIKIPLRWEWYGFL